MNDEPSYVDSYKPPSSDDSTGSDSGFVNSDASVSAPEPIADPVVDTGNSSESLEDQNIFLMLGVEDGNETLRENFLDELQKVIWDDFLENDVELLITSDEKKKFDSLMQKKEEIDGAKDDDEVQNALISYLETLIPDLEDIMLEKALDLKSDLYAERIIGMKEYHASNSDNLTTISSAEKMMHEDKWHSSAELLNKIAS